MAIQFLSYVLPVNWPPKADEGTPLLLVQPDLSKLKPAQRAGFQYRPQDREQQIDVLRSALTLSNSENEPNAWFILLPEYSLPSARFFDCEEIIKEGLGRNSVCIAGFDGFSKEQWIELLSDPLTKNREPLIQSSNAKNYHWVNAAAIWAKDGEGVLHRYLQIKLKPAADEEPASGMLEGEQVFYFEAGERSFAVLICFDIMANLPGGTTAARELSRWLEEEQTAGRHRPITLWVVQNNKRPEHDLIKAAVHELLSVHSQGTVAFVNGAQPDGSGVWKTGASRFFFHKNAYPPTDRNTPIDAVPHIYRRVKSGDLLVTDVSLRLGQPAIHTLTHRPPGAMPLNSGSTRQLISPYKLYILEGSAPRETVRVEACQHEVAEITSAVDPRSKTCYLSNDTGVKNHLGRSYEQIREQIEGMDLYQLHAVLKALFAAASAVPNPDYWGETEQRAVRRMIQALFSVAAGGMTLQLAPPSDSELVTARCGEFTMSVIQGDERRPPDSFFDLVLEVGYTGASHHVLFLLEHSASLTANHPVPILDTGEFVGDSIESYSSGEERMGVARLYCYTRQQLETLILKFTDAGELQKAIKGVFSWQTDCA